MGRYLEEGDNHSISFKKRSRWISITLVHLKMQLNGVQQVRFFRSAPNLWIFVKEVFEVVRKVNDALLHLGDVAPPVELNFTEELWVVCHLEHLQFNLICAMQCYFTDNF